MGSMWALSAAGVGMFVCTTFLNSGEIVIIDDILVLGTCVFSKVSNNIMIT